MKVDLYQIFWRDDQPLDPDCIHHRTCDIPVWMISPLFENYHILNLYRDKFSGADFYGVTSWRMKEKTGLTKKDIDSFIEQNKANAYLYYTCSTELPNPLMHNIKYQTDIGNAVKRIIDLGTFKSFDVADRWVNVFANYFIADKPTWDRYMVILKRVINYAEYDNTLKELLSKKFPFRGKDYPLFCFVIEYLFGLFLADNPEIVWVQIPKNGVI